MANHMKNDEIVELIGQENRLKYVVAATCTLSILGSLLIIITYLLFRELRTSVRLILLHLSIMDMGIALSNMIGAAVNFDGHYYRVLNNSSMMERLEPRSYVQALCKMQAFFAMYSTYGSVFWTNCLAVYLYIAVVRCSAKKKRVAIWSILYGFGYGMPLILSLWLLLTGKLGPTPFGSGGWCSVINIDPLTGQKNYFIDSFGYDMWIYLTFILVPVLYIGTRGHIYLEIQRSIQFVHPNTIWSAVNNIDYKLLFIPLAFIFLRIWSCLFAILAVYSNVFHEIMQKDKEQQFLALSLFYLSAIGDSGQGATNGIIFVLFTKRVREKLFACRRFKSKQALDETSPLNANKVHKRVENVSSVYLSPSPTTSPSSSPIPVTASE